jgi:C2 domain in Dock180 and Zizimin proteins/DOCK N-terminus/DHR-2, Lobe C
MSTSAKAKAKASKSNKKLAALLGADVDLEAATKSQDKNLKERSQVVKRGFQLPPGIADAKACAEPIRLLNAHEDMPNIFQSRFSVVTAIGDVASVLSDNPFFNLVVDFKSCMFSTGESMEIFCSLYSARDRKFITEEYTVSLTSNGFPQVPNMPLKALFRDLTSGDLGSGLHLVARIYRVGRLQLKDKNKYNHEFRRPYGCATVPLIGSNLEEMLRRPNSVFTPATAKIFVPPSERDWHQLHEFMVFDREYKGEPLAEAGANAIGIAFEFRMHIGNLCDPRTRADIPDMKQRASIGKLNWPGPRPGEQRNDLAVCLHRGSFTAGLKGKKSEKNVQVKVTLRNADRKTLPNCIVRGSGPMAKVSDSYTSTVHYHLNTIVFEEQFVVRLPAQQIMEACHLHFEFSHCSTSEKKEQPFSFAYMPLIVPQIYTVIHNAEYKLVIYEYHKKVVMPDKDYLRLDMEGRGKVQTKERLIVSTRLRSTELSQDVDVHQLLNWTRSPHDQRGSVLRAVAQKPVRTLCCNFNSIINKLLSILHEQRQEYAVHHRPAYAALVAVLATTGARQDYGVESVTNPALPWIYSAPFAEHYVHHCVKSTTAHVPIIKFWSEVHQWAHHANVGAEEDRQFGVLRNTMKAIDYVLRVAVSSFEQRLNKHYPLAGGSQLEREAERKDFATSIFNICNHLTNLLARTSPPWCDTVKLDIITNVRGIFDQLPSVLKEHQVVALVCQFVSNIAATNSELRMAKLLLIRDIVQRKILNIESVLHLQTIALDEKDECPPPPPPSDDSWRTLFLPQVIKQLHQHMDLELATDSVADLAVQRRTRDESNAPSALESSRIRSGTRFIKSSSREDEDLLAMHILKDCLPDVSQFLSTQPQSHDPMKQMLAKTLKSDLIRLLPHVLRITLDFLRPDNDDVYAEDNNGVRGNRTGSMPMGGILSPVMQAVAPSALARTPSSRANRKGTVRSKRATTDRGAAYATLTRNMFFSDDSKDIYDNQSDAIADPMSQVKRIDSDLAHFSLGDSGLDSTAALIELPDALRERDAARDCVSVFVALMVHIDSNDFMKLLHHLDSPLSANKRPPRLSVIDVLGDDGDVPPPPPPPPGDVPPPPASASIPVPPPPPRQAPMTSFRVFDFLSMVMTVSYELAEVSCVPDHWLLVRMCELQTGWKVLQLCAPVLIDFFNEIEPPRAAGPTPKLKKRGSISNLAILANDLKRETDLWESFWLLSTSLSLARDLDLQSMQQKRNDFVSAQFGDIRTPIAALLKDSWFAFQPKQIQFLPLMVGPIIDLSQSSSTQVRDLGESMYCDYLNIALNEPPIMHDLQSSTIDAVGIVVHNYGIGVIAGKTALEAYREFFHRFLRERIDEYAKSAEAKESALGFLKDINELFGHLYALESLPREKRFEDERVSACLNLMRYLNESSKQTMYEMYLQYLCELQESIDNAVECGHAVMQYQAIFGWSDQPLDKLTSLLVDKATGKPSVYLPPGSERLRKMRLLKKALGQFEAGSQWEEAIQVCDMIIEAYLNCFHEYQRAAGYLRRKAELYESIVTRDRIFNNCYRVAFYGRGFEASLRNKEFVFRSGNGTSIESVAEFTNRIKAKYRGTVVNSTDKIPEEKLKEVDSDPLGMYVQITSLQPASRCMLPESKKTERDQRIASKKIPSRVRKYWQNNDVDVFTYSRREKPPAGATGNEYAQLWTSKVYLVVEHPIPGLQRRVEVVERHEVIMSPLENACDVITRKNEDLREILATLAEQSTSGADTTVDVGPLSMQLSGVIDAAVQGGISNYRDAFFNAEFMAQNADKQPQLTALKSALADQLPILSQCLKTFKQHCGDNLLPLYAHLAQQFKQMRKDVDSVL